MERISQEGADSLIRPPLLRRLPNSDKQPMCPFPDDSGGPGPGSGTHRQNGASSVAVDLDHLCESGMAWASGYDGMSRGQEFQSRNTSGEDGRLAANMIGEQASH